VRGVISIVIGAAFAHIVCRPNRGKKMVTIVRYDGKDFKSSGAPCDEKFMNICKLTIKGFEQLVQKEINPAGRICEAEFTDFCPGEDKLSLMAVFGYSGLNLKEEQQANDLFDSLLEVMAACGGIDHAVAVSK